VFWAMADEERPRTMTMPKSNAKYLFFIMRCRPPESCSQLLCFCRHDHFLEVRASPSLQHGCLRFCSLRTARFQKLQKLCLAFLPGWDDKCTRQSCMKINEFSRQPQMSKKPAKKSPLKDTSPSFVTTPRHFRATHMEESKEERLQ
jgi:hypothetical protein